MIAASSHKPPMTSDVFRLLLEPTQQELTQILEIREKNRSNAYAPHLSTLAEGIRCFGWVSFVCFFLCFVCVLSLPLDFFHSSA
jgi:adenylyl cyclase-associated protein